MQYEIKIGEQKWINININIFPAAQLRLWPNYEWALNEAQISLIQNKPIFRMNDHRHHKGLRADEI